MYTVLYLNDAGEKLWVRYGTLEKAKSFIEDMRKLNHGYTDFVICIDNYKYNEALEEIEILKDTINCIKDICERS